MFDDGRGCESMRGDEAMEFLEKRVVRKAREPRRCSRVREWLLHDRSLAPPFFTLLAGPMSDFHATDRRASCLAGEGERVVASARMARNVSRTHRLVEVLLENPVKSSAHVSEAPGAFFEERFAR